MFGWLLLAQWIFAIAIAVAMSPFTYEGDQRSIHMHVKAAVGFGALINLLPLWLIWTRPGWWGTRQTIAVVQMLWSALLITITNGRIETHFHVFGSLAFLAFYRDWKVLPTASLVVIADHLARGLVWPDSIYGAQNPEWWRFLEHGAWVAFEDLVLILACVRGAAELTETADRIDHYRALVETTAAVPFEVDGKSLEIRYIAPQAAQLFECTLEELDNGFLRSLLSEADATRIVQTMAACVEHCTSDAIEYSVKLRSGSIRHLRTLLSGDSDGRLRGITIDVTRQKQLETELLQAQKLESLGRLAAGVAHEINTPIQYVSDSVQFARMATTDLLGVVAAQQAALESAPVSELTASAARTAQVADLPYVAAELPSALDRAIEGLDRVATIVRSMKIFAHRGGEMTEIDLNGAATTALTMARNEYKYVADVDLELSDLPAVRCHAGEINQVILNLVVNAAHAVSDAVKPGERGKITLRTRADGDHVVLSVADTGTGIPDELRSRIFEPFFTTKPNGKGTGQGLALARAVVVDKHRGSLTYDSFQGVGTTFHVRIPIAGGPI